MVVCLSHTICYCHPGDRDLPIMEPGGAADLKETNKMALRANTQLSCF